MPSNIQHNRRTPLTMSYNFTLDEQLLNMPYLGKGLPTECLKYLRIHVILKGKKNRKR